MRLLAAIIVAACASPAPAPQQLAHCGLVSHGWMCPGEPTAQAWMGSIFVAGPMCLGEALPEWQPWCAELAFDSAYVTNRLSLSGPTDRYVAFIDGYMP